MRNAYKHEIGFEFDGNSVHIDEFDLETGETRAHGNMFSLVPLVMTMDELSGLYDAAKGAYGMIEEGAVDSMIVPLREAVKIVPQLAEYSWFWDDEAEREVFDEWKVALLSDRVQTLTFIGIDFPLGRSGSDQQLVLLVRA